MGIEPDYSNEMRVAEIVFFLFVYGRAALAATLTATVIHMFIPLGVWIHFVWIAWLAVALYYDWKTR